MRRAVAEREAGVKRAAAENKKLERLVKELEGSLADADEKEARYWETKQLVPKVVWTSNVVF